MDRHAVLEMMTELRLAGMRAAYDDVLAQAVKRQQPVEHVIGELLAAQLADVRARSTAYRMGNAKFPVMKKLAEFDFAASPVNERLVRELHEGRFLASSRNAVFVGGTGSDS